MSKAKTSQIVRPWARVIEELKAGKSRKEVISSCMLLKMKATSAKSFVNSIGCVINAINGNSRKPEGQVNQTIIALKAGKIKFDEKDANTAMYCKKVFKLMYPNSKYCKNLKKAADTKMKAAAEKAKKAAPKKKAAKVVTRKKAAPKTAKK